MLLVQQGLKKVLSRQDGVSRANVNLSSNRARVIYDENVISRDDILAVISRAGLLATIKKAAI